MKKIFISSFLVIIGLMVSLILFILSFIFPWNYNSIDGFWGFLLGSKTIYLFIISLIIIFLGLVNLIKEYKNK